MNNNQTERNPEDVRRAIDSRLSFLTPDPFLAQKVMREAKGETPKMKRKMSLGLVIALALALLTLSVAVAEIIRYNQTWYFENRGAGYANEVYPDKVQAILDNLTENIEQQQTNNSYLDVIAQDASYVADRDLLTFTVRVAAREPEKYELHDLRVLDTDGSYVGEGGEENPAEDGVDRANHWLWVTSADMKGPSRFGPPEQVMNSPSKTLLLFDSGPVTMDGLTFDAAYDTFRVDDGAVILYCECYLNESGDAEELKTILTERDAVTIRVNYRAVEYHEGMEDIALYQGGEPGVVEFMVKVK